MPCGRRLVALMVCVAWARAIEPCREPVNVKTVLFKDTDSVKPCWPVEDIELLFARKIFQDLIPKKVPTDIKLVVKFVNNALQVVKCRSTPETSQMLTLAMYDVLGGYLKSVVLPVLNEAYYAGNIPFCMAAELHATYGRILSRLHTDGSAWAPPCDMRKIPTLVHALQITIVNETEACSSLVLRTPPSSAPMQNFGTGTSEESQIAMPYLDDNQYPNAIAMPLRGNSLFSLMANSSAYLLPKFYILSMRCLSSCSYSRKDLITFNHQFYEWIISSVVPHVHENDRWYPGFGGVLRIVETMNQRGHVALMS